MPINAETYDRAVDEDIDWLKRMIPEDGFHRQEIIRRMQFAKKCYREFYLPSLPESKWNS